MSTVLASLPELPPLVPAATTLNGKRIRIPARVNLGELSVSLPPSHPRVRSPSSRRRCSTPNNIGTVRKLHNCLFPVSYSDRFYSDCLDPQLTPEDYSKLSPSSSCSCALKGKLTHIFRTVFYQDLPVGVLVCRLEPASAPAPDSLAKAVASPVPSAEQNGTSERAQTYKLYVMTLGVLAPYRNQGLASKLLHHLLNTASSTHRTPLPASASSSALAPEPTPAPSKKAAKKAAAKAGKAPAPPSEATKEKDEEKDKKAKKKDEEEKPKPRIDSIYLHVQVGNDQARRFWERFGFEVKETVPDYYRKIEPRDAWFMERKVTPPPPSSA
ncbi:SPOSA6832_01107, partial [Sporobolomyces salmonicolor]